MEGQGPGGLEKKRAKNEAPYRWSRTPVWKSDWAVGGAGGHDKNSRSLTFQNRVRLIVSSELAFVLAVKLWQLYHIRSRIPRDPFFAKRSVFLDAERLYRNIGAEPVFPSAPSRHALCRIRQFPRCEEAFSVLLRRRRTGKASTRHAFVMRFSSLETFPRYSLLTDSSTGKWEFPEKKRRFGSFSGAAESGRGCENVGFYEIFSRGFVRISPGFRFWEIWF